MRRLTAWISGSGGGISAIAFFLPWVSFSCAGEERAYTGVMLASEGNPQVWAILVLALAIAAIAALFWQHAMGRFLILLASLSGMGLLIIEYLQQVQSAEAELKAWGHTLDALNIQIRLGGWGAAVGFLVASIASVVGLSLSSTEQDDHGESVS